MNSYEKTYCFNDVPAYDYSRGGGCSSGKNVSSGPKLAVETQREKAAASAAAVEAADKDADILRVVTDLDCINPKYGYTSQASRGQKTFETIVKHFGGTPSGIKAKLEVLPMDGDSAYDAELTKLRTEIVAGNGPDVFLMSGFGGGEAVLPKNTLFQNPESAMKKGLFLPLDKYIENAQFMEFDKFDPEVMAAGRGEQGQLILPMFYRLNRLVAFPEDKDAPLPVDWNGILFCTDNDVRVRSNFGLMTMGFREMCLDRIADAQSEDLLINQEEFFLRAKEALDFYTSNVPQMEEFTRAMTAQEAINLANSGEMQFFVPGNASGNISAAIETWCAVSSSTNHPEDAFFIADIFLSEDFLRQEAFWNKQPPPDCSHETMTFFWVAGEDLVPVHTGLLSGKGTYKYNEGLVPAERIAIKNARENISCAYFTSNIDREIDHMMAGLFEQARQGGTISDDELRRMTNKTYTTLKMMLAES